MHEYPIEGMQDGTLRAEKDGLYWKIDASCTRDWDHPIRLLAETGRVAVHADSSRFDHGFCAASGDAGAARKDFLQPFFHITLLICG